MKITKYVFSEPLFSDSLVSISQHKILTLLYCSLQTAAPIFIISQYYFNMNAESQVEQLIYYSVTQELYFKYLSLKAVNKIVKN
jgi:hypothetical protein